MKPPNFFDVFFEKKSLILYFSALHCHRLLVFLGEKHVERVQREVAVYYVEEISVLGRSTQGVTLIRTNDGGKVVSVEIIDKEQEEIEVEE